MHWWISQHAHAWTITGASFLGALLLARSVVIFSMNSVFKVRIMMYTLNTLLPGTRYDSTTTCFLEWRFHLQATTWRPVYLQHALADCTAWLNRPDFANHVLHAALVVCAGTYTSQSMHGIILSNKSAAITNIRVPHTRNMHTVPTEPRDNFPWISSSVPPIEYTRSSRHVFKQWHKESSSPCEVMELSIRLVLSGIPAIEQGSCPNMYEPLILDWKILRMKRPLVHLASAMGLCIYENVFVIQWMKNWDKKQQQQRWPFNASKYFLRRFSLWDQPFGPQFTTAANSKLKLSGKRLDFRRFVCECCAITALCELQLSELPCCLRAGYG